MRKIFTSISAANLLQYSLIILIFLAIVSPRLYLDIVPRGGDNAEIYNAHFTITRTGNNTFTFSVESGTKAADGTLLVSRIRGAWFQYLEFFGSPNIAMLLAALLAIYTLAAQMIRESRPLEGGLMSTLGKALEDPLQTAGVIILITGAGGAFGGMIRLAGIGETIEALAQSYGISYILLAWGATAIIRIAQGSATVAMITGVGLMAAIIGDGSGLDYHPFYIFLAIGFGSITLSWMNDSGFWVVQRLSGFTEKETLKTWSVLLTAISLLGLVQTLVFSKVLSFKPEAKSAGTPALVVQQK